MLWMGPGNHPSWTTVVRLRLQPDAVERTVEEVRTVLRDRGRTAATWEVGTSSSPPDLADRLQAAGMVPDDEPLSIAMVLETEPELGPVEIEARAVQTLDEYRSANEIAWTAFGMTPEKVEENRADLEDRWVEREASRSEHFLAFLDGEPVATANAVYGPGAVMLYAGATLPGARGRGAYRALVRARWDAAVARGTPALITQAGHMSRPILRRLGFVEVAENRVFLDRLSPAP